MGIPCTKFAASQTPQFGALDRDANHARAPGPRERIDEEAHEAAEADQADEANEAGENADKIDEAEELGEMDERAAAGAEQSESGAADAEQLTPLEAFEKCRGTRPRFPAPVVVNEGSVSPNVGRYFYLCDRPVKVVPMADRPHIVWMENLLSPQECQRLQCTAQPRLQPSKVYGADRSSLVVDPARRLSEQAHLDRRDSALVATIEDRISRLLGWPVDLFEPLQIQRYGVGGHFNPHQDQYAPRAGENPRIATLIMYLNEPEAGGETVFLQTDRQPLKVKPRLGAGVLFTYPDPDNSKTLHKGAEVTAGEKWIITAWPHAGNVKQHGIGNAGMPKSDTPLHAC